MSDLIASSIPCDQNTELLEYLDASWTIGFGDNGMPNAYIVIYSERNHISHSPDEINEMIVAEIPDLHKDPELYEIVKTFMIHDGSRKVIAPYVANGNEVWPKPFSTGTCIDLDGTPIYRRRLDGRTLVKNGKEYHNGYVIPYNKRLSLKYETYVSVELHPRQYSRFTFIKYHYERQRHLSACQKIWKDLGFPITYRTDEVITLPMQDESLEAWMQCNNMYDSAKELTYRDLPTKFVWKNDTKEWVPREHGVGVGRIQFGNPDDGESYYIRLLLCKIRGPRTFEALRTVNGKVCKTYKEACCELGFMEDRCV